MRYIMLIAAIVISSFLAACSSSGAELPPGHCYVNSDCPQGHTCRNERCEDIYFPDAKIKSY
ncbi:MAG TPA: hypothetical protein PLP17_07830 [Oligoflexia bacterium]|nr:hypothetical protein [Oligoflexia bacterium]